jgi:transitional endoplasmic reticulum ATPase
MKARPAKIRQKTLVNMPDAIFASAWRASDNRSLLAIVLRKIHFLTTYIQVVLLMSFWLLGIGICIAWLGQGFAVGSWTGKEVFIPAMYSLAVASFYILMQWIEVQMCVPRADPEYPLIHDLYVEKYGFQELAKYVAVVAVMLAWMTASSNPQFPKVAAFASAGVCLLLAASLFLYSRNMSGFGHVIPTAEERDAAAHAARARQSAELNHEQQKQEYRMPVEAREARLNFSDIFGMQIVKDKLLAPAQAILRDRAHDQEAPGNGILMHGEPGNGKTAFAEALAGQLDVPFIQITYGDISSKWLGEMPRLLSMSFEFAKEQAPCVLFIDEIDSFIRSRDSGSSNPEDLKITNTLLTEIVNLREHPVVLVAATNFLNNLDAAAIREGRFDFKVEITPPDEVARIGLLESGTRKYSGSLIIDPDPMKSVARRWGGFSVSRLLAVVKALPDYARDKGINAIGFDDWMGALRTVQGRKGQAPAASRPLNDLILQAETRDALNLIAGRLKDVERIESMGGTLPNGILFHGPSGTGKTAAARALALESGWAFLSVAGPDLLADREKITKVYAEAKDLRPTLVFIDEADDVMRNRQLSVTPDLVNRLLALMDGTAEKIKDVVFIAATNHPDQIDPALLRAGRFTEKVAFFTPPVTEVPRAVAAWLRKRQVNLEPGLELFEVADLVAGESMANIEGILQYALNRSIPRHSDGQHVVVRRDDLIAGRRVVASA